MGYAISLTLALPLCFKNTIGLRRIISLWHHVQLATEIIYDPNIPLGTKRLMEATALRNLLGMKQNAESISKITQIICLIHIIFISFIVSTLILTTFIILRALFFQLKILKRYALRLEQCIDLDFSCSGTHRPKNSYPRDTRDSMEDTAPVQMELKTKVKPEFFESAFPPLPNLEAKTLKQNWTEWLPTLRRGTGLDGNMWASQVFREASLDRPAKFEKHRTVKRYIVNTTWQLALSLGVSTSYLIMLFFVGKWTDHHGRLRDQAMTSSDCTILSGIQPFLCISHRLV